MATTGDVDQIYRIGDQLHVQPDVQLEGCFDHNEAIRMTRQEVAIARSHIEAWKAISAGADGHVMVLEDDVWFRLGAAKLIDQGWDAAMRRSAAESDPNMLYLSYADAGGTAERAEVCETLFRPIRGLWHLSGYVLSREGANELLRSMPVVGPVDLWMNYRFEQLGALALTTPAILQRADGVSDNCYSILPYLARAGVIDADAVMVPDRVSRGLVLAWRGSSSHDGLAMALSMLGLRVRTFDGTEDPLSVQEIAASSKVFDALIDPPLSVAAMNAAVLDKKVRFVLEDERGRATLLEGLPKSRTTVLRQGDSPDNLWQRLCGALALSLPAESYPLGPAREWKVFHYDRPQGSLDDGVHHEVTMDDSPWGLARAVDPPLIETMRESPQPEYTCLMESALAEATSEFSEDVGTFPGNLVAFVKEGLSYSQDGARLSCSKSEAGNRAYRSGALVSMRTLSHGRVRAEIKAASGRGLVTGFFLHRNFPRQEIDIEILGNDPTRMLVNVFFNPGDHGANFAFGYRGSPCLIDLGFDATKNFHLYEIEWQPGYIAWIVDGRLLHRRLRWNPTPIPHLPMRLHANLWIPRSEGLAGCLNEISLPTSATFRNVSILA